MLEIDAEQVFIVGELSANHNGDLDNAIALVNAIADAGAHAVKMQTYTPDGITLKSNRPEFMIKDGLWAGKSLYDLYQKGMLPWAWHEPLYQCALDRNIIPFSAPFDLDAVDFLETLGTKIYKIASPEIVDIPLIAKTAQTGKPLIISCGMATLAEITLALETATSHGAQHITLLHCVSAYPTKLERAGLGNIALLAQHFPTCRIGLSDHTIGGESALAAVACGAKIIEKHVTLKRCDGDLDGAFSLEPHELADMVQQIKRLEQALKPKGFGISKDEQQSAKYRRSLYAIHPIKKGMAFTADNIKSVRPANGLPPKFYHQLLASGKATEDIAANSPLTRKNTGFDN